MGLGFISLSRINFQLKNQWVFFLTEGSLASFQDQVAQAQQNLATYAWNSTKSIVNSFSHGGMQSPLGLAQLCQRVTLPRQAFEISNHPATNKKYYTRAESLPGFSAEFLETGSHDMQKYFTNWERSIFDPYTQLFNSQNPKRNGYLWIYGNAVGAAQAVAGAVGSGLGVAGNALGRNLGLGTLGSSVSNFVRTTTDDLTTIIPAGVYHFEGVSYKGMQEQDFIYDDGGGMKITVNFEVDRITPETLGNESIALTLDLVNAVSSAYSLFKSFG